MDGNGITIGIDPGATTSVVVTDSKTWKLIEAFEFKHSYKAEFCQRMTNFIEKFTALWQEHMSKYQVDKVLLEVPYSVGRNGSYIYQRGEYGKKGKNGIDLVKLISTVLSIYQALTLMGFQVITIPATYWLSNKEKFEYKKYCTQDLIDFEKYKFIKSTRDGIVDAVLMSLRYNRDWNLQKRVSEFMGADFSKRS